MPSIAAASTGRVIGGVVVAAVGCLLLLFNRRVTIAAVTAQKEGLGTLLGARRSASDKLQSSKAYGAAARVFVAAIGAFFVVVGVGMAVTSGH